MSINPRPLHAGFVTATAEREAPTLSVMVMSGHNRSETPSGTIPSTS